MKKIVLALMLLCLCFHQAIAQPNLLKFNSPIPPSPTASSLGKYGDIPVATYTGIPNIQIPIYEIKIGTNTLPIGISYYSGGFKVAEESSSLGLGWSLNAGGVITRTKKMKDDLSSDGYYKNSIHTENDGKDKEPDIFYFNFAGSSGKFMIDYSSNPSQPYIIRRISTYNDDDLKIILNSNQTWQVIDKYGVKYEFNTTESQNDNTAVEGTYFSSIETSDYISSWYLSKIIYTNGEEILFNYTSGAQIQSVPIVDQVFGQGMGYVTYMPTNCYMPPQPRSSLSKTTYNVKVNTIDLSEIIFPGGKIEFDHLADRIDLRATSGQPKRLVGIKIYNLLQSGYNLLKTFNFGQSYFSSSNNQNYLAKRLRLDKVSELGSINSQQKDHEFSYSEYSLPDKDSKNIDHWGYYCGPRNNDSLFPKNSSATIDPNGNSRNPDPTYVKSNLLSSIKYPSQLYTYFNFEINDFSNLGTSLSWSSLNSTGNGLIGGGVRIKSILNNDGVNTDIASRKEFDYISSSGNQSSGKIMSKISYSMPYEVSFYVSLSGSCSNYSPLVKENGYTLYSGSSIPISGDAQGNIIGYDRVIIKNVGNAETTKTIDEYYNNSSAANNIYPRVPQVNNNMNGLLKFKTDYIKIGSNEIPIKQTELSYTTKSSNVVKGYLYTASWRSDAMDLLNYDILTEWIVNSKVTERVFEANLNNASISKTNNFIYDNSNRQKIQEDYIDSRGDTYTLKFLYPKDMVALGKTDPYQEMENRHMTGLTIQFEKYKNAIALEKTFNDYLTNWPNNNSLILPSAVRTQYMGKLPENRLIYNEYDKKGNPITVSYANGMKTTYLWSYDYQNPIAEIKNADFSSVASILGAVNIDNFAAKINPDKATIDSFLSPLYVNLPNSLISKYSYMPLVGLLSQTDAKAQTIYYEYDGGQRLVLVKDQNEKIIKSYKYNYAPNTYYSVRKEQDFTKDNCPSGSFVAPTLFVVAAGQFTSVVSQADADQQAESYLLAHGQEYANTNGICRTSAEYSVSYTVDPYFSYVNYTLTKSFDDEKRALCKIRVRYDPISGGGALTDVIEQVQMEKGVLEYSGFLQVNAGTTVEVELMEVIEN